MVAVQRPKLVWMPLPEPGPGLLLFWIRLNFTNVGLAAQVESNSMPEILFWTMLLRIWAPPLSGALEPGFIQIPDKKQGSDIVDPWTVKPSRVTLSASICTGPQGSLMIDSLAATNRRVLASMPAS